MHVVTGAFSYTGRYIAGLLVRQGREVATLTRYPEQSNPFGESVRVIPLRFDDASALAASLRGTSVLYNTYWIRFSRGRMTFDRAIANSEALIRAAAEARRFVHISVTNPSPDSPLPYFRGKAAVERALAESDLSYAIVRPTLLFGTGDILINNIGWVLRRLPAFGVFGSGRYRLQPVYVGDVADIAVRLGGQSENVTIDAAGPETYTFEELLQLVRDRLGSRARIVHVPPALAAARLIGWLTRDVAITRDEIRGLMAELLVSAQPSSCPTRFSEWLVGHAHELGTRYASELQRHHRR